MMFERTCCVLLLAASLLLGSCGSDSTPSDAGAHPCPAVSSGTSVALRLESGALRGTLELPDGEGPHDVALIVAGSGPTDRDGNNAYGVCTDAYAELAHELAIRGVASLRYDKRGVGASAPAAEADLRPADEADDVAAWLAQLKADARFSSVIVVGHSEGSLLAMLAMQKVPAAGFISLAGPGRRMADVFRDQLARQLRGALLEQADWILGELEAGRTVTDIPAALSSVFRASVQPYLIALLKYDPTAEIGRVSAPTLIAQGTTDIQVAVTDAQLLAAARPDAEVLIVEGMCHTLKVASLADADQVAALTDPMRPLAPALVEGIGAFLRVGVRPIPGG